VAHKCQSSYTEARNTAIRGVAADSIAATQRIVALWGSVWEDWHLWAIVTHVI